MPSHNMLSSVFSSSDPGITTAITLLLPPPAAAWGLPQAAMGMVRDSNQGSAGTARDVT